MKTVVKDASGQVTEVRESDDQQCSMEVSRNAKGELSWSAKVYSDDADATRAKIKEWTTIAEQRVSEIKQGKL